MSYLPSLPEVGRIVEVTRGRDTGLICVVIGQEADRYVFVADGDKRPVERPKKKNVLHVRNSPQIAQELLDEMRAQGKVTNAKVRHAIRLYQSVREGTAEAFAEGGKPNGER